MQRLANAPDATAHAASEGGSLGSFGIAECIGLGSHTYTDGNLEVTVSASATTALTLEPSVAVDRGAFSAQPHIHNIVDSAITVNFEEHGKSVDLDTFSLKKGHLELHGGVNAKKTGHSSAEAFVTLSCIIPAGGREVGLPGRHGSVKIDGEVTFDLSYSFKLKGPPPPKPVPVPVPVPAWEPVLTKAAQKVADALKDAAPGLIAGAAAAAAGCFASGLCEVALLA